MIHSPVHDFSVSVVIPCFNGEDFVAQAIDSALNQTVPPREIIVVDDGSTDGSREIVQQFGSPVRLIAQANQGESVARNVGFEAAKGQWVAFLDADDIWRPEKTARQLDGIENEIASACNLQVFRGKLEMEPPLVWGRAPSEMGSLEFVAARNSLLPSSLIVRRTAQTRFPTWTQYGEDLIYSLELVSEGAVRYLDEPLLLRRVHGSNQSGKHDITALQAKAFLQWMENRGGDFSERKRAQLLASHADAIIDRCELAKYQRSWVKYESIREALKLFGECDNVRQYLAKPVYPKTAFWLVDMVRRCIGQSPGAKVIK